MEKQTIGKNFSKIKIFGISLLAYIVLNIIFSLAYFLLGFICITLKSLIFFFPLSIEVIEGGAFICAGVVTTTMIQKLIKSDTDENRVNFTLGVISILINIYSILNVFRYGDEFSYRYILFIIFGIIFIVQSKRNN